MKRLFPLETDKKSLELARDRLLSIQDNARGKEPTVDKLSTLATQFAEKREVRMCRTVYQSVCVAQNCVVKYVCVLIEVLSASNYGPNQNMCKQICICYFYLRIHSVYVCSCFICALHIYVESYLSQFPLTCNLLNFSPLQSTANQEGDCFIPLQAQVPDSAPCRHGGCSKRHVSPG